MSARMLSRKLLLSTGLLALTCSTIASRAEASGALLMSGATTPVEERIAIAAGPTRTTIWTSLRVTSGAGPFALIVPVPPGATLDHSSDAWLEALDAATAPRVFPPSGASPYCPGKEPPAGTPPLFDVTTDLGKTLGLKPSVSTLLPDAWSVALWASQEGLSLSADMLAALEALPGMRFFAERFEAPSGPSTTTTLRVVLPGQTPYLPLALSRATSEDLLVTTWILGQGRADVVGAKPVEVAPSALHWLAFDEKSNYGDARASLLGKNGPSALLLESASHDALVKNVSIANGTSSITGVVRGFFERASTYGDGNQSPSPCITAAGVALESSYPVAESCPRAELGVVDGAPSCMEAPVGAEVSPALLRCGGMTDDLAVALSGLVPSKAWLSRVSMQVPQKGAGSDWAIVFGGSGVSKSPLLTASSIDLAQCSGSSGSGGASGSTSSGGTGASGQGSSGSVSVGTASGGIGGYEPGYEPDMGCACAGTAEPVVVDDGSGGDYTTSDTSSDDCSGDTTDTSTDTYSDTSSGDCSGDTTDTSTDTYSDTSSDDCSGDTSTDTYGDTSSDDCSGDTSTDTSSSDSDCSGDTSTDTGTDSWSASISRPRGPKAHVQKDARMSSVKARKRAPKVSVLAFGLFALLAPLRRLSRPSRGKTSRKGKAS